MSETHEKYGGSVMDLASKFMTQYTLLNLILSTASNFFCPVLVYFLMSLPFPVYSYLLHSNSFLNIT